MGGLALALRLAHRGHAVTIFEKTGEVGGRNRRETVEDCRFDGGPTLLMMLDPFKKLFADVGERFEDHVKISLCDPSYRVFYADGKRIDGSPNVARMLLQIEDLAGATEAAKYPAFLGEIGQLYHDSIPYFVRKNYNSVADFAAPAQLARVLKHRMLGSLGRRIERTFKSPYLRMLFSFQTLYLGLSPYDAPWVYATLAYMEYGEGIWYPQGGLPAITEAISDLARARGVTLELNSPVCRIDGNRVHLEDGRTVTADAVICNADLPYAQAALAKRARRKSYRASCSAFVLYLKVRGDIPELEHHNVFFGSDFRGNLDALFSAPRRLDDPAFYACISSRSDPTSAPDGFVNLYVLIPCPNLDTPFDAAEAAHLTECAYQRLERETSFRRDQVVASKSRSPHDWRCELNLDRGAAFGISHDLRQSAFMRPSNQDRENPHLLYVGASTVPGNGLPMVLISAELAEERLERKGLL